MAENPAQRLTNLYLGAAVVGVLAVIVHFAVPLTSSFYVLIGYVLDILIGIIVILIALRAKKTLDRAPLRASLAGVIYSLISGIGTLLFPPSAAALRRAMQQAGSTLTQAQMKAAFSLGARLFELVVAVIFGWLIALFVGWIASLFAQKEDIQSV
jgi:ABC-type transport system involved in cytochrome bd biosynthesis fused ATPase/permease subunit